GTRIGRRERGMNQDEIAISNTDGTKVAWTDINLDFTESNRLAELENIISSGIRTFDKVGTALFEIRDARLYRQEHKTFKDYCRAKWKMTDRRPRQLIDATATVATIR